jgi:Shwachman-Bodian-Diamond syndrome (SBDS) protein
MTRGKAPQTKVHYSGTNDDYVIFVDSTAAVHGWRKDRSVPLAQVVSGWKVFCTHKYASRFYFSGGYVRANKVLGGRHGAQGILDSASKGQLEGEFGTTNEEDIVKIILEKGSVQETVVGFSSFSSVFWGLWPG